MTDRGGVGTRGALAGLTLVASLFGLACPDVEMTRWSAAGDCPDAAAAAPWQSAAPEALGMDAAALDALSERIARGELGNLHSLLVVRGGKLVFERYFAGRDTVWGRPLGRVEFDAETLHDLRSVTKSVVGALVGIAHADGSIPDLDQPLLGLVPVRDAERAKQLRGLSLRHALTMSAGLSWDELSHPYWDPRNDEGAMWRRDDPIEFVLSRPILAAPGTRFAYNGGLPTVLAAAVEAASGTGIDRFAAQRLMCPLGIREFEWLRHGSGVFVAASGMRLRPRDMARFGLMMLDHGRFAGQQIVPAEYVRSSLSAQVDTGGSITESYGYQWWVTQASWQGEDFEIPVAFGNGGQRIAVFEPAGMVVVVTAGAYDSADQRVGPWTVIEGVLGAARRIDPTD